MAKILLVGDSHIIKPNVPRYSRHQLLRPNKFPSERFPIPFAQIWQPFESTEKLKIVFIGNHLGRKGEIAALRWAQKARNAGLPLTIHIVSKLDYGGKIWTDFPDKNRYKADLKLLNLDNVIFHGKLPNQKVIELLAFSHFHLLTTLHDTYGYSVIESFSVATPAITTNVAALPEFVHNHKNGYLLNLELNEAREWKNSPSHALKNTSEEYWEI